MSPTHKKQARVSVSATADRDELFQGAGGDLEQASMDQRSRLLQANQRMTDSTKRLQDSHRVALESEEIGNQILGDLHQQRETIVRTSNNVTFSSSSSSSSFLPLITNLTSPFSISFFYAWCLPSFLDFRDRSCRRLMKILTRAPRS